MSGIKSSQGGLTRRGFLKGAAAVGVATGGMMSAANWISPLTADADELVPEEYEAHTYHQFHCGSACAISCGVRDGRLVSVYPNEGCAEYSKTLCVRALSEVEHVYGAQRNQSPLKRVGERGSNEFVAVTWDEALDEICSTIKDLQGKYGKNCVLVDTTSEANFPWLASLLGAQTIIGNGIDLGVGNGMDPAISNAFPACATCEARDWKNSKMVLTVGSNFLESSLATSRNFFDAKEAGARMVTVDPHYSVTAGKSDEWIPIVPGTDAALFLGMTSVILEEKLYDEDFVLANTSLPFLVSEKTGKILRQHKVGEATESGEENPFFVWDETAGGPVSYLTAKSPALRGTYTIGGETYATAFTLLERNQKKFTAEWAREVCEIPAETIARIAREYAAGPSILALGWGGNEKFNNADISGHSAIVLAALTGNIAKKGAGIGVFVGGWWNSSWAALGGWALPEHLVPSPAEMPAPLLREQKNSVRAGIFCGDAIQQHYANMNKTVEWAKTLDLIVSIDPYFTEGAKWSDFILPVTTRFELDEEVGNIRSCNNTIALQEKVIDPLFEAKTDFWVTKEIAKRFDCDSYLPASSVEYVSTCLATSPQEYVSELTIEKLKAMKGVCPVQGTEEPRRNFMDFNFGTASGRMEVYYESMVDLNQSLPAYEPPSEAGADNPLRSTYPLQLASTRTRYRIHNQFNGAKWLDQYRELTVEINPADARSRGLAKGDTVRVFNDRGEFFCVLAENEAVRPGSVRMFEGVTEDFCVKGNMQNVTNDETIERSGSLMYGAVIPFSDTLVEVEKA